jgi:dTMP kinase
MTSPRGRFIVFEGIDGSGKSTQVELLAEHLRSQNREVYVTRQPSDRFIGKAIRKVLSREVSIPPQSLAGLFLADRYDHILGEDGLLSKLDAGIDVICDRYFWSSFAYHGLDMEIQFVIDIHKEIFDLLTPDITLFIDILPEVSIQRIANRSDQRDLFEKESILSDVRQNYLTAFAKFPDVNIQTVDGAKSMEEVSEDIQGLI